MESSDASDFKRRAFFHNISILFTALATLPAPTLATETSTGKAEITDKIFLEIKGLSEDATAPAESIVIGLFGKDAPQPVSILKQLVSKPGYFSPCKPREERLLQREQLEANKVYNNCIETQDKYGVTYDNSAVWRIDKDRRIDVGAVTGKFLSRVSPNFQGSNSLKHDSSGVVSVRRGDDGGFGFTIFPSTDAKAAQELDEDNIVVGRVLEGMDIIRKLNDFPVFKSSSVNYMALTGGPSVTTKPTRACRYGGPLYCNELKPLKKVVVFRTGIL